MSSYCGTEAQQRLQRKSDRLTPWIMRTPGACLTGRIMGSDDPDRLGWDIIHQHLQEDGLYSFRWVDQDGLERIREKIAPLGATIHGWHGFCRDAKNLRDETGERQLPAGLSLEDVNLATVTELQAFLDDQGIVPLSGAVMSGGNCVAGSAVIRASDGSIAAAGFVGMLQNAHSPLHDCAWAGLIACDSAHRGQGLGQHVTRALIRVALERFDAQRVMAFAAADNPASKSMLEACGLRATDRASYVATLSESRFTR